MPQTVKWPRRRDLMLVGLLASVSSAGCSLNRMAVNKIGDALAGSGTTFSSDDDPELVGQAIPFSLKLIESLLASAPEHRGLLLAASSGFTEYAFAYVQLPADTLEDHDLAAATAQRARARRLYLRARDYGLRGLATRHPRFAERLRSDAHAAVLATRVEDVPLLYWTAASWGAAISLSKDDPDMVADLPLVEVLIDRALALDESWGDGSIHGFLITYEMARQGARGDPVERSRAHFDRVVALTGGQLVSPYVSFVEAVCIPRQDRREFDAMLQRALAVDPNARPQWRLENLILQRRARWLLSRADQLFLDQ